MGNTKPFVQAACACETVIFDKDNVASVIRIIDTFKAHIPSDLPAGIPAGFPINVFVRLAFPEGIAEGAKVAVQGRRPDGTKSQKSELRVEAVEGHRNVQIKTEFHIVSPQAGTYWFDVLWANELLTSIPIMVTLQEEPIPDATRRD